LTTGLDLCRLVLVSTKIFWKYCPNGKNRLSSRYKPKKFMETLVETRANLFEKGMGALKSLFGVGAHLKKSSIDQTLKELVAFRVSQINGCAYCLDMHSKDARANGETEQRLYSLSAWRETPYYSDRERAALEWTEAVTKADIPDAVYSAARSQFSEEELIDLTLLSATTGVWNRLNIAFHNEPGTYRVGQFG
jgi:AhpD family alkylhydroperoxidase